MKRVLLTLCALLTSAHVCAYIDTAEKVHEDTSSNTYVYMGSIRLHITGKAGDYSASSVLNFHKPTGKVKSVFQNTVYHCAASRPAFTILVSVQHEKPMAEGDIVASQPDWVGERVEQGINEAGYAKFDSVCARYFATLPPVARQQLLSQHAATKPKPEPQNKTATAAKNDDSTALAQAFVGAFLGIATTEQEKQANNRYCRGVPKMYTTLYEQMANNLQVDPSTVRLARVENLDNGLACNGMFYHARGMAKCRIFFDTKGVIESFRCN